MSLTGLFLGAGASHEAGMPLVWDLTAEIKAWLTPARLRELNGGWRLQDTGHPEHIVEEFITVLARPLMHYEAALGHLELQFRRNRPESQAYYALYSWMVEIVYRLLYYRQVNNAPFFDRHLRYYDGIKALVHSNTPLWIFSLNHDLIVETIAHRLSIPVHSGFGPSSFTLPRRDSNGNKIGHLTVEALSKAELDQGRMHFANPFKPGIYLLKIHGALDVFTYQDGENLLRLKGTESGNSDPVEVLRAANEELIYVEPGLPGGRAKTVNEITYADDQGEMQFLRRTLLAGAFKFDPRGTQVLPPVMLRHFEGNINFLTKLVCIGYGFGDHHINEVMRRWLEHEATRQLEIVSPIAQSVPAFLLHLCPQVTLTASTATDYLDRQAGIVRSRNEIAEKRLAAHLRSLGKDEARKKFNAFFRYNAREWMISLRAAFKALRAERAQQAGVGNADPFKAIEATVRSSIPTDDAIFRRLLKHFGVRD